jgi:hypothetical protein
MEYLGIKNNMALQGDLSHKEESALAKIMFYTLPYIIYRTPDTQRADFSPQEITANISSVAAMWAK